MKKGLLSIILMLITAFAFAQSPTNMAIDLSAAASSYSTFSIEFGYRYGFNNYVGLRSSLRLETEGWEAMTPFGEFSSASSPFTHWDTSKDERLNKIYLGVSLPISSPPVMTLREMKFWIQLDPGVYFTVPYSSLNVRLRKAGSDNFEQRKFSSHGGQWIAWYGKTSVMFSISNLSFGIGYGISNLDPFSSRRRITVNGNPIDSFYERHDVYQMLLLISSLSF